ncbi:hypothetical protein 18India_22 [Salmonella phage 18-India]|nr:hypothetical protein 18India_22 [Salmonella phage 18-India]
MQKSLNKDEIQTINITDARGNEKTRSKRDILRLNLVPRSH